MNISQAANLIIRASLIGKSGKVYVLNMGEPIKMHDFLMEMIDRYGDPEQKDSLVITGLQPGEKLFEELYYLHENIRPFDLDLFVGDLMSGELDVNKWIEQSSQLVGLHNEQQLKVWLAELVRLYGDVQ